MTSEALRSARLHYARRYVLEVLRVGVIWAIMGGALWGGAAGLYVSLAPIPIGEKVVQASLTAAFNVPPGAAIGFAFGVALELTLAIARTAMRFCPTAAVRRY